MKNIIFLCGLNETEIGYSPESHFGEISILSSSPSPLPQLDTRSCDLHCSSFGTNSRVRIFESVRRGDGNLRSGVIFFFWLLCFFGTRGKKSRTQITEIKGEGMIAG